MLNDNKIEGSKNVLLLIVSGSEEITIDEIGEINEYIQTETGNSANIIMGVGEDLELGNNISVTVIATGFGDEKQKSLVSSETKKVVYKLDQDHPFEKSLMNKDELDHLTHESDEIVEDKIATIQSPTHTNILKSAIENSDAIIYGSEEMPDDIASFITAQNKPVLEFQTDDLKEPYLNFYTELLSAN